jgi:carbamoyl-phosphate synthase large subunit
MRRIYVSGASGLVGYGILKSLRQSKQKYFLLGSSIHKNSIAPIFCDSFEIAPKSDSSNYIKWLVSILKKYKIDIMFPGIEVDMYKWSYNLKQIKNTKAFPVLNQPQLIFLCEDKWKFYKFLKSKKNSCVIRTCLVNNYKNLTEKYKTPFLLKPRKGFGSKGVVKIYSKEQFEIYKNDIGNKLMVQPYVGSEDEEYTVSIFGDGIGSYFAIIAFKRRLSPEGYTAIAETTDENQFIEIISKLCKLFKPIGPTNFQFRLDKNEIKLLEINPRISSTTSIKSILGYNESLMSIEFFLNKRKISQPKIQKAKVIRYIEDHIFYEDSINI